MVENLTEFINAKKNIITNIDPDGFFSFALLHKFFGCDLVGFTNSKEYVYLINGKDYSKNHVTYVDMYVCDPTIQSIDQHIVTYSQNENNELLGYGTKLNPNIYHEHSFTNYKVKYPFSTFIYLCTLLEKEGYVIDIDWNKKITDDLDVGSILLRIDGVLTNLADYTDNCINWLKWTEQYCNGGKFIKDMKTYIDGSISVLQTKNISNRVEDYFKMRFHSESKDGGYKSLRDDNFGYVFEFMKFAFEILNVDFKFTRKELSEMHVFEGGKNLSKPLDLKTRQDKLFSCAIVNMKENNLSYTNNVNYLKTIKFNE